MRDMCGNGRQTVAYQKLIVDAAIFLQGVHIPHL
jgi:hypothetical protein